jgi:hypothetical protein
LPTAARRPNAWRSTSGKRQAMLDHITFAVADFERSKAFYD